MKNIYFLTILLTFFSYNIFSQCTPVVIGGGSYSDEISVVILDCEGSIIYQANGIYNESIYDCIDLPDSYTIEMYDTYGDGWTGNVITLGSDNYTMSCGWPNCIFESVQVDVCLGCTDTEACNFSSYAEVDDQSCIYIDDCAGICGGTSIEDDCGNCYDPQSIVEIESTI